MLHKNISKQKFICNNIDKWTHLNVRQLTKGSKSDDIDMK